MATRSIKSPLSRRKSRVFPYLAGNVRTLDVVVNNAGLELNVLI
jgi:NADP-dependent 3-hydroxy acid dehydrogenase YdfG